MSERELLRRVGRQSKIALLAAEAKAGALPTSDLIALLDLLAAGPNERKALARGALEILSIEGQPAGRVADLRVAFGLTDTVRLPGVVVEPPRAPEPKVTETRRLRLAFRAPFEADPPDSAAPPEPPEPGVTPPALETTPTVPPPRKEGTERLPAAPRAPLPIRGLAAATLVQGSAAVRTPTPVPPLAPLPAPAPAPAPALKVPGPAGPAAKRKTDIFFGDGAGLRRLDALGKPAAGPGAGARPAPPGPGAAEGALPMDFAEANAIASAVVARLGQEHKVALVIAHNQTAERAYAWIFRYTSKQWVESGSAGDALVGLGPLLVLKRSREVFMLPTAFPVERTLEQFEKALREKGEEALVAEGGSGLWVGYLGNAKDFLGATPPAAGPSAAGAEEAG